MFVSSSTTRQFVAKKHLQPPQASFGATSAVEQPPEDRGPIYMAIYEAAQLTERNPDHFIEELANQLEKRGLWNDRTPGVLGTVREQNGLTPWGVIDKELRGET